MKLFSLVFLLLIIFNANQVIAADYYNKNAGFGFWYPGSWTAIENGRSATISGGEFDQVKSEILIGSDWIDSAKDLENLKNYLQKTYAAGTIIQAISFSDLKGFLIGNNKEGEIYLLREPSNIIYIQFRLNGTGYQFDQAKAVLNSIYIRTNPIEN